MSDGIKTQAAKGERAVRLAALGGVLGPILFAALVIVGGLAYDGYSHVSQKISELGGEGAENAVLQNLNFAVLGILILGFSWALARVFGPSYIGAALIGYFGLVAVAHAWIPCDVGCKGETTIGLLHNITGLSGFIAAIVGMFLLARRWRDEPTWYSHAGFTRGAAAVALGGLVWFVITQAADIQSLAGIAQRIFAGALLTWIATTAWKLHRQLETSTSTANVEAEVVVGR
jgi:hypothetical membrane protein